MMLSYVICLVILFVLILSVICYGLIFYKKSKLPPICPESKLASYFNKLYPTGSWNTTNFAVLESLYLNLDCWYTKIIKEYKSIIEYNLPTWSIDMYQDRFNIPTDEGYKWARLFDGSVCDCLRYAYPSCKEPDSRFSGKNVLVDCPTWDGLRVGKTYKMTLLQMNKTNNTDPNFIRNTELLGKGFPNNSWVECLAYPGEYGHPDICGNPSTEIQPGVQIKNKDGSYTPFNKKYSDGPWWGGGECGKDDSCKFGDKIGSDGVKVDGWQVCKTLKSNGDYPIGVTTDDRQMCIAKSEVANNKVNMKNQFIEKFVDKKCDNSSINPCNPPSGDPVLNGFHGLWLYPLRGVGMWRNLGNSVVTNTKLGYLISPRQPVSGGITPIGCGFSLEDMIFMSGSGGGSQNLKKQLVQLTKIIQQGYQKKSYEYPYISLATLAKHGGPSQIIKDPVSAKNTALELMKKWYIEGYSGLLSDFAPNGFNYNYNMFFPIGAHFSYAASYDNLVLYMMVINKIDTLQLLIEPQNSRAGLKPAYLFELFQATPGKKTVDNWSVFGNDFVQNQCKSFYMINPADDMDNFIKYGYVHGDKTKTKPEIFDPSRMKLTSSKVSF